MRPLVAPLRHGIRDLHVELLRQMQLQQAEFEKQLRSQSAEFAALVAEVEELRRENARLRGLY